MVFCRDMDGEAGWQDRLLLLSFGSATPGERKAGDKKQQAERKAVFRFDFHQVKLLSFLFHPLLSRGGKGDFSRSGGL